MAASLNDKITDTRNAARPNSALVSSGRSAGGATLACDNLAGWPTASKVHFVTYRVDSSNVPVPGTQLDCEGIVSGNNITSFTVIDGTDAGNAVNDVVEMLPTAGWGQDLADALMEEHNRDGTHGDITADSVSTDTIEEGTPATGVTIDGVLLKDGKVATEGAVENTAVMVGMPVQTVCTSYTAVSTGSTLIPNDDTIPQNIEGDEYMTIAITPKSATNILVIEAFFFGANSVTTHQVMGALFQDTTADAIAAAGVFTAAANAQINLHVAHSMVAVTTSSTTFKLRVGGELASTTTFNGAAAGRKFGAISKSYIKVTEFKAS